MVLRWYWRVAAVAFVGVAAFLLRERAHAQSRVSNDFVVTHVRVFDGARTLQDTHVAVTGGIIRAVGGDLVPWQRLPAFDGTGLTLVPGLIDSHAHVRDAEELRQAAIRRDHHARYGSHRGVAPATTVRPAGRSACDA